MTEDEETFAIKTTVRRSPEDNIVLKFTVIAEIETGLDKRPQVAANLTGFIVRPFMWDIENFFDIFDSDTQHGYECWEVLTNQSEKIKNVISKNDEDFDLEHVDEIIFCQRVEVLPKYRGQALALRLMREIRYVFSSYPLMVLRAWPDENGDKTSARQLAQYYMRDIHLGLMEVDSADLAGWLVGIGDRNFFSTENKDEFYIFN